MEAVQRCPRFDEMACDGNCCVFLCKRYVALAVIARQINQVNDTTVVQICTIANCGIRINVEFSVGLMSWVNQDLTITSNQTD